MSHPPERPVNIPNLADLEGIVVRRCPAAIRDDPHPSTSATDRKKPDVTDDTLRLSRDADRFLRYAAEPTHRGQTLEQHWAALGISSGSVKDRVLNELRTNGLIRLERKGKSCRVHLFTRAYEYLGLSAPTGKGVGGTTHQAVARHIAALLKSKGYEAHIDRALGAAKKRVDVVGYGTHHIIGVEIGLSDERQEIKNLRDDWETGVLDVLLFVTTDESMLENVRSRVQKDPVLNKHTDCIHFLLVDEEKIS